MKCSYNACTTQVSDTSGLCIQHTQLRTYVDGQLVTKRSYKPQPPVTKSTLRQQAAKQFDSMLAGSPSLREAVRDMSRYLGVEGKTAGETYGKLMRVLAKRSDSQPYLDQIVSAIEKDNRRGDKDIAALRLLKRLKK